MTNNNASLTLSQMNEKNLNYNTQLYKINYAYSESKVKIFRFNVLLSWFSARKNTVCKCGRTCLWYSPPYIRGGGDTDGGRDQVLPVPADLPWNEDRYIRMHGLHTQLPVAHLPSGRLLESSRLEHRGEIGWSLFCNSATIFLRSEQILLFFITNLSATSHDFNLNFFRPPFFIVYIKMVNGP